MPVPASINDLSTTAGSNSPPGSESPATVDDYLRTHASFIAQLRDSVNGLGGFGIGSAAVPNIGNLDSFATRGGLYRWQNGVDTGTAPVGESNLVVFVIPFTASIVRQEAFSVNGASDTVSYYTRQGRSGTTFGPWVQAYHTGNVSAFVQTLLDDTTAANFLTTLGLTDSGWQTPALQSSFVHGDEPFRYRILYGKLEIVGSVKRDTTPTAGMMIFSLPVGFRPNKNSLYYPAVVAQIGPLYQGVGAISVGTTGTVSVRDPLPSSGTGAGNYQIYINYSAPVI